MPSWPCDLQLILGGVLEGLRLALRRRSDLFWPFSAAERGSGAEFGYACLYSW
jgi:hypothetical protein